MTIPAESPVSVVIVTAEAAPLTGASPLGEAVAALARALGPAGVRATVIAPRYGSVDLARWALARRLVELEVPLGATTHHVGLHEGRLPGSTVQAYLLEHPWFGERPGVYGEGGRDYPDNVERFALLSRAALALVEALALRPTVIHAHDWPAGLVPVFVAEGALREAPATVFTLHDPSAQGLAPAETLVKLGLRRELLSPEYLEFYGRMSALKGGVVFADRVTTVSPRYAELLCGPAHGHGLEGLFAFVRHKLIGILHGGDAEGWDSVRDRHLPETFAAGDPAGKGGCKEALQAELGLPLRPEAPLVAAVGDELAAQLLEAADALGALDLQAVVIAPGEAARALAEKLPRAVAVRAEASEALLHRVVAAADLWLAPPERSAGSTLVAMRYGAVPVARADGAVDDVVVDYDRPTATGTGFVFAGAGADDLAGALHRAAAVFRAEGRFRKLQHTVMTQDFTWKQSATRYLDVYREAVRSAQR